MAEPSTLTDNTPAVEVTAAQAAKAVKRQIVVTDKDGKPTDQTKDVPVSPGEVLSWAVRGNAVTVVTKDGQKLVGTL